MKIEKKVGLAHLFFAVYRPIVAFSGCICLDIACGISKIAVAYGTNVHKASLLNAYVCVKAVAPCILCLRAILRISRMFSSHLVPIFERL